ncbi:tripartite tricarboxylate transporter TctB family protein [Amylibacter sp.]|nr:tripartite tricarboxylate transporter TctB family protein [Amylibacter sp.]|tara:strand:- start:6244 stop:6699 length:456 start_codon:yes stop_codon:yes gene_type:complete
MNIFQHKLSSGFVASVAFIVCYISFTRQPSDAYLFPRVISVFFLTLSLWTFIKALLGLSKAGNGLTLNMFRNMLPGMLISSIYLFFAAKFLGFYTATTIAFFLLLTAYDPESYSSVNSWVKRIIITACFIAIMYTLFAKILVVYTPRGMFI